MTESSNIIKEPELLRKLPISRRTLLAWRKAGKVPFIKSGRAVMYHWPSVEAALVKMQEATV